MYRRLEGSISEPAESVPLRFAEATLIGLAEEPTIRVSIGFGRLDKSSPYKCGCHTGDRGIHQHDVVLVVNRNRSLIKEIFRHAYRPFFPASATSAMLRIPYSPCSSTPSTFASRATTASSALCPTSVW